MDHFKDLGKTLWSEFSWLIIALIVIGILWAWNGGQENQSAHEGAYIKPLAPLDSGEVYGTYYAGKPTPQGEKLNLPEAPANIVRETESVLTSFLEQSKEAARIHATSLLGKSISFDGVAGAKSSDPDTEYIRIVSSAQASGPILISGLVLKDISMTNDISIPKGVLLPLMNQALARQDIYLQPGGRALISTGESPIGASFQANICSGYLGQFQTYTPALRKDCPMALDELESAGLSGDSSCKAFVNSIPQCSVYRGAIPSNLSDSCKKFVTEKLTYNGCVANHKNDSDFYTHEWRIYLNQSNEIWANSNEIIRLLDSKGNVIDALTY